MAPDELILAIDQGSSSTKALLVSAGGAVVATGSCPLASGYPRPGWVEQSATEILASVRTVVADVLADRDPSSVVVIGLSTQRESLLLWDRETGSPVGPLISWQDQRTTSICDDLIGAGYADLVRRRSGLPLDPMFSATKARWLLDHTDPDRTLSKTGRLCLGTVDAWLLFSLTGEHIIEVGNAARTQLLNVHTRTWDPELLELFAVPREVLPHIVSSTGPFPPVRGLGLLLDGTPIGAVLGDSHAALFAHAGWTPGTVKATYGTGSSVMGLCPPGTTVGEELCLTIAWDNGQPAYAVEGNILSSGATLSWLARTVGSSPAALADLAATAGSDGVHLVPAFNGLGAPWWDRDAVGLITGLTLGSGLPQIARAALESVALQVEDVVAAIDRFVSPVHILLADGGASANPVLMQLQADLSGRRVEPSEVSDLSPLGAAHMAGHAVGIWTDHELQQLPRPRRLHLPRLDETRRRSARQAWLSAVATARVRSKDTIRTAPSVNK